MSKFADLSPSKQKALLLLTQQIVDPDAPRMTYEQIATAVGVDRHTLLQWRTENKEFAAAREELVESYADEMLADAFGALRYQLRKNKNVKAAETVLKSRGKLIDRGVVQAEVTTRIDPSEQSTQELLDEVASLRAKLVAE